MNLTNQKCLVVGLGISGMSAARFLRRRGADVIVTDTVDESKLGNFPALLKDLGVKVECGPHRAETFEWADMIVLSPGVPHILPQIIHAKEKGALVIGEIELAYRFIRQPIIAVTGTNGKTTVTTLLGNMLKSCGISVFVGGNIGNPLIDYVDSGQSADWIVAEISSFQLDTIESFRPRIAVLLNITEDHLDRYDNFQAYVASKGRIFENQSDTDTAVMNYSDDAVRSLSKSVKSRILWYGYKNSLPAEIDDAVLDDARIDFNLQKIGRWTLSTAKTQLYGSHNMENIAAACLAGLAAGCHPEGIEAALASFKGLPHRIEFVADINGVRFFDDSKGTNIDAVIRALEGFKSPVILIMGGRDKGSHFQLLEASIRKHVNLLILIGESKQLIKDALGHLTETKIASSMEEAVLTAFQAAKAGDVVLLSPACASFDMYRNYAERGKSFCNAVLNLKQIR